MKTTFFHRPKGVALVIVLTFLILFSALTLAFFSTGKVEMKSSSDYAAAVTVRQLADTAVNIVQAQISDGARSFEVPDNPQTPQIDPKGKRLTWTSGPGLIHTYAEDGTAGRTFKLFSARNMVEDAGSEYLPQKERTAEVPNDWASKIALYTDLNQPVLKLDPAGKITRAADRTGTSTPPTYSANYPILDPSALGLVEGLRINLSGGSGALNIDPEPVPGYGGRTFTNPSPSPGAYTQVIPDDYDPTGKPRAEGLTSNPAPMPVQWMYVLANGKVTAPDGATPDGKGVTWRTSLPAEVRPGKDNPIVGRIAFWTDDDSCKININTASEGTFTDRAWANSNVPNSPYGEQQLRDRLPIRGEYQRYPGHPATVCLSPVLGGLNPSLRMPVGDNFSTTDYNRIQKLYYDIAPRVGTGGTFGGTVETGRVADTANIQKMRRDENRLYSSVDELAFGPPDTTYSGGGPLPVTMARKPLPDPATNKPLLGRFDLERAKFFLTAYNRAPETNVFGKPRISLWMLQQERDPNAGKQSDDTGNRPRICPTRPRNAKDDLLAYCSTVAGNPFYFQRYSIYLGTVANGRKTTSNPFGQLRNGYVGPSSQSTFLDWNGPQVAGGSNATQRNRELYSYLQRLTLDKVPGWGKALNEKYPGPIRDQILTEMIDLLRSGTNCYAQDAYPVPGKTELDVRYEYAPARRMPDATMGETQIVPLEPPDGTPGAGTKGFGRFPTITEAALIFYVSHVDPATNRPDKMRIVFMVEPYSPTAGSWTWSPLVRYVLKGLEQVKILPPGATTPVNAGFMPVLQNLVTSRCGYGSGSNHNTAYTGTFASFRHWNTGGRLAPSDSTNDASKVVPAPFGQGGNPELQYNFVSNEIPINPTAGGTFQFFTGNNFTDPPQNVELQIHSGYSDVPDGALPDVSTLVQTVNLHFPSVVLPLPRDSGATFRDFSKRIVHDAFGNIINSADTVRSLEIDPKGPTKGDFRLVAGLKNVPADYFAGWAGNGSGDPGYSSTAQIVHSLRLGNSSVFTGGRPHADLFSAVNSSPLHPIAARGLMGATMANGIPGDFDNGPFDMPDGAYINKPDDYYGALGSNDRWESDSSTPNRQVCSGAVFGSLPVMRDNSGSPQPWRTLLFCAVPSAGRQHPGFASPRDHLFLDFFTMPIVEPYAISEPFSTAGKVNLNYELAPFTYIIRNTALHGVLRSTRVTALPNGTSYKSSNGTVYRKAIDANQTLSLFNKRFATNPSSTYTGDAGPFRTASEVCDMPLVPTGTTATLFEGGKTTWWDSFKSTGDNARESAYNAIYPRVTTRSNVFTVHMRVQALRKVPPPSTVTGADREKAFAEWYENKDQVVGEYRGSTTIERYIDLSDPSLSKFDFATKPEATMDEFYRFRVVSNKRFNP